MCDCQRVKAVYVQKHQLGGTFPSHVYITIWLFSMVWAVFYNQPTLEQAFRLFVSSDFYRFTCHQLNTHSKRIICEDPIDRLLFQV